MTSMSALPFSAKSINESKAASQHDSMSAATRCLRAAQKNVIRRVKNEIGEQSALQIDNEICGG